MLVGVLSDTHAPRFWKSCPLAVARELEHVEAILHAGDACTPEMLEELSAFAPVHAVRGNNDDEDVVAWGASPETLTLELDGVNIGLIHNSGARTGRVRRLRQRFPEANLVVYGHSHIPLNEREGAFVAFNPGSPTDKRAQRFRTMGLLRIDDGILLDARIVILD